MGLGIRKRMVCALAPLALKAVIRSLESGEQGQGALKMWTKLKTYLNGKKRYTGALMIAWPGVILAVARAAETQGFDPEAVAWITALSGGVVVSVIGWIHWLVKSIDDLSPDDFTIG